MLFRRLDGEKSSAKHEPSFKDNTAPLQRKQSAATKANKQQAVVQPLQGWSDMSDGLIESERLFLSNNGEHLHIFPMLTVETCQIPLPFKFSSSKDELYRKAFSLTLSSYFMFPQRVLIR